ncbi:hypothetical protein ACWCXH_36995 [Kitasatospora sp. NPDC001660]
MAQILRSAPDRFDAHIGGLCPLSEDRQLLELAMTVTARIVIGTAHRTDDVALLLVRSAPR